MQHSSCHSCGAQIFYVASRFIVFVEPWLKYIISTYVVPNFPIPSTGGSLVINTPKVKCPHIRHFVILTFYLLVPLTNVACFSNPITKSLVVLFSHVRASAMLSLLTAKN